jgi:hypothetical protein
MFYSLIVYQTSVLDTPQKKSCNFYTLYYKSTKYENYKCKGYYWSL